MMEDNKLWWAVINISIVIWVQFYELKLFLTATRFMRCSISLPPNVPNVPNVRVPFSAKKTKLLSLFVWFFKLNTQRRMKIDQMPMSKHFCFNKFSRWKTFKSSSITDELKKNIFLTCFTILWLSNFMSLCVWRIVNALTFFTTLFKTLLSLIFIALNFFLLFLSCLCH